MWCTRLAENTGGKNDAKIAICAPLHNFAWLHLRNWGTYRQSETPVKHQRLPHMSSQDGELRPTSGWDLLASLGHPSKFQHVSRLGSVTARHSSSGRQPKFAALNRRRHLHSARRRSRWALAHILVWTFLHLFSTRRASQDLMTTSCDWMSFSSSSRRRSTSNNTESVFVNRFARSSTSALMCDADNVQHGAVQLVSD